MTNSASDDSYVNVLGASVVTPLGADTGTISCGLEAGLNSFVLSELLGEERAFRAGFLPDHVLEVTLPVQLPGITAPQKRLLKIASIAIDNIRSMLPKKPVPLLLALGENYYKPVKANSDFVSLLLELSGLQINAQNSQVFCHGTCSGLSAIDRALHIFATTDEPYILLGGVDSFCDTRTLTLLDDQKRLGGSDGFLPAEGASFILLASAKLSNSGTLDPLLKMTRPEITFEPGSKMSKKPYTAQALSHALSRLMSNHSLTAQDLSRCYSSNNGESHYSKELSIACSRSGLYDRTRIINLPEYTGDMGAAFVPAAIALEAQKKCSRYHDDARSVILASSDSGARGAICLF